MAETPTVKSIVAQLPEEIIALVLAVGSDLTINRDNRDVAELLPHPAVIRATMADAGLGGEIPQNELDQADAWMQEQRTWQDRAMKVQAQLQEKFPFTRQAALKGELPGWATEPWSTRLLYQWSDGLQEAVMQAETYLLNK